MEIKYSPQDARVLFDHFISKYKFSEDTDITAIALCFKSRFDFIPFELKELCQKNYKKQVWQILRKSDNSLVETRITDENPFLYDIDSETMYTRRVR